MRCDAPLDSLSIEQSADGVAKSKTATGILVTVGGQSTFGGAKPSQRCFLSQFSMTKKIGTTDVARDNNLHVIPVSVRYGRTHRYAPTGSKKVSFSYGGNVEHSSADGDNVKF